MLIEGIDIERVEAAVFDLGGVFLAGGVESVQAFGDRHGLTPEAWRAIRRDLFNDEEGIWSVVERGQATFTDFVTRLRKLALARCELLFQLAGTCLKFFLRVGI